MTRRALRRSLSGSILAAVGAAISSNSHAKPAEGAVLRGTAADISNQ